MPRSETSSASSEPDQRSLLGPGTQGYTPDQFRSAYGITGSPYTLGEDSTTPTATRGYDTVTGLGAPIPAFVTSFPRN